ncbi:hypothetical protein E0H75_41730 [Kribbella capetownensis]|uniref:Uncharacterized protein n=1 Tax=Kribbella capetownensis TaxID=1572659 RepID=A0A4R0IQB2_9ACTN|nr:hypothetical protein [Kribbella capetownensis]TCC34534.1 hypothetical protein E0H75_41730 [Kribbella capetownensis]
MTEHPGEQFPPDVDPDVEPGFEPSPAEEAPAAPDYDAEPGSQSFESGEGSGDEYAEAPGEPTGDEPAHVDPAEVEFGPEFAREPGQEYEHPYEAESAEPEHQTGPEHQAEPEDQAEPEHQAEAEEHEGEAGHPLVDEVMGRLDELRERPVDEHADVYADLHERLQTALVEADAEHGDRG